MPSSVLFTICALIWGSTYWAITTQLGDVPPAVSVVYRFSLASSALFLWCLVRGDRLLLPWRAQRWLILQGLLTFCLSYVCTYTAEQYVVSALVAVIFALMVFFTPLCARIAFGTPIPPRTWAAGGAAIVGVTLLFYQSAGAALHDLKQGGTGTFILGAVLAVSATIASSAGAVVVSKVREQSSILMLTMAWSMLWGTLAVAGWALASGQQFTLPKAPGYWAGLLYLSIFGSVIAFHAYFTLINRIGSHKTVYISVITPVISVLLSIRLENFRPGLVEWVGFVVCLGSVAWALRTPAAKPAATINLNNAVETTP